MTGHEIRVKREALGLTIQELSSRAGISFVALQRIESGKTTKPHKLSMKAIESALADAGPENVPEPR